MNNIIAMRVVPVLVTSLLAACGTPDPSSSFPTDRFYARFVAETHADGTSEVRADFFEKDEWFDYEGVYLDGGDTLTVRTETHSLLFEGGGNHFVGQLTSGIAENTRFQFDLQRPVYVDAPDSYGTLPAPMDILMPEAGQEYSVENDKITVAWTTPGTIDDMWLRVDVDCLDPNTDDDWWLDEWFTANIPGDPGAYTLELSGWITLRPECRQYSSVLTLYRGRLGQVDLAYKPNEEQCGDDNNSQACEHREYVSVRQVRSVPIVLKP